MDTDKKCLAITWVYLGKGFIGIRQGKRLQKILGVKTNESKGIDNLKLIDYDHLTTLILSRTELDAEGVKVLADVLKTNTSLKNLQLPHNRINAQGVKYLEEALTINTTLKYLDLSSNMFFANGIEYISNIIKVNHSLIFIDVRNNYVSIISCIVDAIKVNTSLRELYIGHGSNDYVSCFKEAMIVNMTLIVLDTPYVNTPLLPYLERNRKIRNNKLKMAYFLIWANRNGLGFPKDVLLIIVDLILLSKWI